MKNHYKTPNVPVMTLEINFLNIEIPKSFKTKITKFKEQIEDNMFYDLFPAKPWS